MVQCNRFYGHAASTITSKFEAGTAFTRESTGITVFHFMSEISSFFMMHFSGYLLPAMHVMVGASFETSN